MSHIAYPQEKIKEVHSENMIDEIRKISELLEEFNYLSMDTEFPGVIYPNTHQMTENIYCNHSNISLFNMMNTVQPNIKKFTETPQNLNEPNKISTTTSTQSGNYDLTYKNIKSNVDQLKIIQLGITLSDKDGNHPEDTTTWQFNFKFDLNRDKFLHESIQLLEFAGIDFNRLCHEGIDQEYFAENIIASGIVLNENVKWITFHGAYDFAYLLKTLSNQPLPEDEQTFLEYISIHFPNYYDLRYMIKNIAWLKGSLSRIATDLEIKWNGAIHQAGCDSLLTSKVFTKLCSNYAEYLDLAKDLNVLFGLNSNVQDDQDRESLSENKFDFPQMNSSNGHGVYNNLQNNNTFQIYNSIRPNNKKLYNPYAKFNSSNQNSNVMYSVFNNPNIPIYSFNNYGNYDHYNFYARNVNSYLTNGIPK